MGGLGADAGRAVTLHRFHVPALVPQGETLSLPPDVSHHIRHVLRLAAGAPLRVFDGEGHEAQAVIERLAKSSAVVRLGASLPPLPEPSLSIVLALAPLKGDLLDLVIQKTTELGVAEIWPVITARTDPPGRAALEGARLGRWRRIAAAAAAQCGRSRVPHLRLAAPLADVLAEPFDGRRFVLDPASRSAALDRSAAVPKRVLLLVGPAGGWTSGELRAALEAGFQPLPLGPRTLRAETAALAAVTALQVLWGDLR